MNRLLVGGDIAAKLSQYRRCLRKGQAQSSSRSKRIVNPSTEVPVPPFCPSLNIKYAYLRKSFTSLQVSSLCDLKIKPYINVHFSKNGHVMEVEVMLNIAGLLWYIWNQRWVGETLYRQQ